MSDKVEIVNGLIPFEMQGDGNKFDDKFMPVFMAMGLTATQSRGIVQSIWLFGNNQWSNGYNFYFKEKAEGAASKINS